MQSITPFNGDMHGNRVLLRRPAIPRWWDHITRPHVAVLVENPKTGCLVRYYLSEIGPTNLNNRATLDIADLDSLPDNTLLEVRHNAQKVNLYRLELVDGTVCWRWIGRYRGLLDFEQPSMIDWRNVLNPPSLPLHNGMLC